MKRLWVITGRVVFWASWPLLWLALRLSTRSRVLIVCGDEVLLLKNWHGDGKWCMPGGGLRPGEDPLKAARRELKEELGLELSIDQPSLIGPSKVVNSGLTFRYIAYVCKLPSQPALKVRKWEIIEVAWLPLNTLGQLATDPSVELAVAAWQGKA